MELVVAFQAFAYIFEGGWELFLLSSSCEMFISPFCTFQIVLEDNFQRKPEEVKTNLSVKLDNNTGPVEVSSFSKAPCYENRNLI